MPVNINTITKGRENPNNTNPRPFVSGDPDVWEASYAQMAAAKVPQKTIDMMYHMMRANTGNIPVTHLGISLLRALKLKTSPSGTDIKSVMEWLANAFAIIAGKSSLPHSPKLDTLDDPGLLHSLEIVSLFDPRLDLTEVNTENTDCIMEATHIATGITDGKVPLDDEAVTAIVNDLNGSPYVPHEERVRIEKERVRTENENAKNSGSKKRIKPRNIPKTLLDEYMESSNHPTDKESTINGPVDILPDPPVSDNDAEEDEEPMPNIRQLRRQRRKEKLKELAGQKTVEPNAPAKQDVPAESNVPEVPVEPETPGVPYEPVKTEEPKAPVVQVPAESSVPEVPVEPETPGVPYEPVKTEEPKAPVVQVPAESPEVPEIPEDATPVELTEPEVPGVQQVTVDKEEPRETVLEPQPELTQYDSDTIDVDELAELSEFPETEPAKETVIKPSIETPAPKSTEPQDVQEPIKAPEFKHAAVSPRKVNIPQRILMEIFAHAGSKEQIKDAIRLVEQDIADNTPNAQFLVRFVPGVTQDIVKDILTNRTASGKYITRSTGKSGNIIPHTSLTGGNTYTSDLRTRQIGPVEVPPGFAQENSSVLWDEPVITTMGYPFINFGAPEIYTILKDKDERKVKAAYQKLKKQLKKVGLDSPIKVLKDFRNSKGVPCALNRITVDSDDLLEQGNSNLIATVYPRAASSLQAPFGNVPLTRDFIVEMYRVLSPTQGARIYMDTLGMTEEEYADTLNRDGRPPVYIFIPKEKLGFKKAPAGFIARLLTGNNKPTLVEARIGTHMGGFVMPFKTTRMLFTEV